MVGRGATRSLPEPYTQLQIDGQFFTRGGKPHTLIECSDFSLFKRWLSGEDTDPVLTQRQALGFNLLRVWVLNTSVVPGGIHPVQHQDFYPQLRLFCQRCGTFGLGVEITVFTQAQTLMPKKDDQQRHLDETAGAVRGLGNVILELVNEGGLYDNAPAEDLRRPAGVVISRGSGGADELPSRHDSPWDYECYHTNDLSEWWRKVGHNAMEWADESKTPCLSNENTRFVDRDASQNHAFDAARAAALLCAGSCFHSQAGKLSQVWTGQELVCATAWAAGARSVPLEFQKGSYRHRADLESPEVIRVYSRTLGGQEYVVQIRK